MLVIALVTLLVARVVPGTMRALRAVRAGGHGDGAAAVLQLAVGGLRADRLEWGHAMLGELHGVEGSRARWSFSLGCVRAALALRVRAALGGSHRDGAFARTVLLGAVAAALMLSGYGLVHYPLLGAGGAGWTVVLTLPAVLIGYVVCALGLSRGMSPAAVVARRYGLFGGVAVGSAWLAVVFPSAPLKAWVAVPLAIAMFAPAGVAALTARATSDAKAATAAAAWCGLVGGVTVFVVWVTGAYAHGGPPFDPQLVRDFHASGATDITAYAVAGDLGAALGMLVVVPVVALAAGTVAARLAATVPEPKPSR